MTLPGRGEVRIVAAAIRLGTMVFALHPPARHHHVMWWLSAKMLGGTTPPGLAQPSPYFAQYHECVRCWRREPHWSHFDVEGDEHLDNEQGFLTSEGLFVDRKTALKIATAAKQLIGPPRDQLYSEEVW